MAGAQLLDVFAGQTLIAMFRDADAVESNPTGLPDEVVGWDRAVAGAFARMGMEVGEPARDAAHRSRQTWETSDFLKKSKCSSASPVPRATQLSEFSATWQGTPVPCQTAR